MKTNDVNSQNKIFTIPNLLSVFRICLIPVIAWLYLKKQDSVGALIVLLVSGFTDIADGWIARHFNMISNLGKIIDPIADKLTQGVMLLCLLVNFPVLKYLFLGLIIKETLMALLGMFAIYKTGVVLGAKWHGKLTTVMIYSTILLHFIWNDIPQTVTVGLTSASLCIMILSYLLYTIRYLKSIRAAGKKEQE